MPLSKSSVEQLEDANLVPIGKLLCIFRAGWDLYKCVQAAGGDTGKKLACLETFVKKLEECMSK